jgi:hypothetical protein
MVDLIRRSMIIETIGLGTTVASALEGSIEGQAHVQAEQALTVNQVDVEGGGDVDAQFTRVSDDNTEFQAAFELNNDDSVSFNTTIKPVHQIA